MRFLVHPGFHKTGTSSIQASAAQNRAALEPMLRIMTMDDFPRAVTAARRHSKDPAPRRLHSFAQGIDEGLATLDPGDARPVFVTCEKFLGWIPGRKNNWSYAAAPDFMARLVDMIIARFPKAEVTLFFTTREAEAWKRSVYWQNLRAMRITEDFAEYGPRLNDAAKLNQVVEAVVERLGPRANVQAHRSETLRNLPHGPFGAILNALGLPSDGLPAPKLYNMQPEGAAEALLELNRSDLDDSALDTAKRKLMRHYQSTGLTRASTTNPETNDPLAS